MKKLLIIVICGLLLLACGQGRHHSDDRDTKQQEPEQQTDAPRVAEQRIHLVNDSGFVCCYADSQKVVFNDGFMDGDAVAMLLYQKGRYAYAIGDLLPHGNGWTCGYQLYRIDTQTLKTKYIGGFAAIHFDDDGFKAATARLTNPNASCTAEEIWVMRDNFYSLDGKLIRKGKDEYDYEEMIAQYSDSLVNADGHRVINY